MSDKSRETKTAAQDPAALLQTERNARLNAERELAELREKLLLSGRMRTLGYMATGMAHELSQPLTGVIGQAEFLQLSIERGREFSREDMLRHLQPIVEQAERMVHAIDSVRRFAYAKPTTGSTHVNAVVRQTLDLLQTQLHTHGIDLVEEMTPSLPPASIAEADLEEALLNILINARDAVQERHQSSGQITVRTSLDTPDRIALSIGDNGDGISEAIQERVFEPFFSTRATHQRAGLGLSIARALIERSGGKVQLSPRPDEGALAVLYLPTATACEPPTQEHK